MEGPEAAQLTPLAQGLCSYAQRFNTTLDTVAKSVQQVRGTSLGPSVKQGERGCGLFLSPSMQRDSQEQQGEKRKEREEEAERATTPDAAEALTALQGLDQEAEENGELPSLLAEPRYCAPGAPV